MQTILTTALMQKTFKCEIYFLNAAQEMAPTFHHPIDSDILVIIRDLNFRSAKRSDILSVYVCIIFSN